MNVTPLIPQGRKIIQSYGADGFKISGAKYTTPVIVTPTDVLVWNVDGLDAEMDSSLFSELEPMKSDLDVLLVGCGHGAFFISPQKRQFLKDCGYMVDVMDTGAACRTYNVLLAEGRRVAAALMPLIEQKITAIK